MRDPTLRPRESGSGAGGLGAISSCARTSCAAPPWRYVIPHLYNCTTNQQPEGRATQLPSDFDTGGIKKLPSYTP